MEMSVDSEHFDAEWRERIQSSADVQDARNNLQFHKNKIKEMHDELMIAEAYESELEKRLESVKERLKPPLMRFMEKLKIPSGVDKRLAGDTVREVEDTDRIVTAVKERANKMDQLSRSELVGFLQTILHLRDSFLEEEIEAGSDVMQLGRPTITWEELSVWEARVLRKVVREVKRVPVFLAMLLDQSLRETIKNSEDQEMDSTE